MALFFLKIDFRGLKYHFKFFCACLFEFFFDACPFGIGLLTFVIPKKFFSVCVFENIFWHLSFWNLIWCLSLWKWFCGACLSFRLSLWKFYIAGRLENYFFWRLSLWKYSSGSCCIENIFGFCRYENDFLAPVASKIFWSIFFWK